MIITPDFKHSILNVSETICQHYHVPASYAKIPVLDQALKTAPKHVVLMLLDGMGYNIIDKHLRKEDFLKKHLKDVITSIYPPTTVAATNTVLSAKPPYVTGFLGWVQYFKKENTNCIVFLNLDYYDEKIKIKEILRDKYLKYETIYEKIETHSPRVKTYELFPSFRVNGYKTFSDQLTRCKEIVSTDEENFTYVYWTDPDLTEHTSGIYGDETIITLRKLNHEIQQFSETLADDTLLVIIADHGLVDVKGINLFEDQTLFHMLKRKPSMEPRSTNFFVKFGKRQKFKRYFNQTYGNHFKLYSKRELYRSGLLGTGQKHPMLNSFLGQFVAIATDEYMFNTSYASDFKAHHAGLTKDEMEVPLIIYKKGLK